ncbi:hypothetical protein FACS1894191_7100 [Clostridia bacterium]|nr:hypothetical protein FACS1894191_7100 [Clostridia bacterium]
MEPTYRIAVGTSDGKYVDEHFGQAGRFVIMDITRETGDVSIVEERLAPIPEGDGGCGGHNNALIAGKIGLLLDCQIVLVAKIGGKSEKFLLHNDIIPLQFEGDVESALERIKKAYKNRPFLRKIDDLHRTINS